LVYKNCVALGEGKCEEEVGGKLDFEKIRLEHMNIKKIRLVTGQ